MFRECYWLQSSPVFQLGAREEHHFDFALGRICLPCDEEVIEACVKMKVKIDCDQKKKSLKFKSCLKKDPSLLGGSLLPLVRRSLLKKLKKLGRTCLEADVVIKGRIKIKTTFGTIKKCFEWKMTLEDFLVAAL